jgi:hypothetical protein
MREREVKEAALRADIDRLQLLFFQEMREREVKEAALRADIDRLQAEAARLLAARHL